MNSTPIRQVLTKAIPLVIGLGVLFIFGTAHAGLIKSYINSNSTAETSSDTQGYYVIGSGITGTPSYFQFYVSSNAGTGHVTQANLIACHTSTYTGCYVFAAITSSIAVTSSKSLVTVLLSATTSMNVSDYFYMNVAMDSVGHYYGDSIDPYPAAGRFCRNFIGSGAACTSTDATLMGGWFLLGSSDLVTTQPQVFEVTSPTSYSVSASTDVGVTCSYLNDATSYSLVGLEVTDLSNIGLSLETGEGAAARSGIYSYFDLLSTTANHGYRVRCYLKDGANNFPTIYGPYTYFSSISDTFFGTSSPYVDISTITESNASSTSGSILNRLGSQLVNWFQSRVPWGYLYDISAIYRGASTNSSQFSALAYDFGSSSISTSTKSYLPSTLVILSTSTVTQYLPSGVLSSFNALATAALYVTTMIGLFYRIRGLNFTT